MLDVVGIQFGAQVQHLMGQFQRLEWRSRTARFPLKSKQSLQEDPMA